MKGMGPRPRTNRPTEGTRASERQHLSFDDRDKVTVSKVGLDVAPSPLSVWQRMDGSSEGQVLEWPGLEWDGVLVPRLQSSSWRRTPHGEHASRSGLVFLHPASHISVGGKSLGGFPYIGSSLYIGKLGK